MWRQTRTRISKTGQCFLKDVASTIQSTRPIMQLRSRTACTVSEKDISNRQEQNHLLYASHGEDLWDLCFLPTAQTRKSYRYALPTCSFPTERELALISHMTTDVDNTAFCGLQKAMREFGQTVEALRDLHLPYSQKKAADNAKFS